MKDYSGRFGDIWEYKPGVWWAIEFTPQGNERLRRNIPETKLKVWLKRLGVPTDPRAQSVFRTSFPKTAEEIQARFDSSQKGPKSENPPLTDQVVKGEGSGQTGHQVTKVRG